MSWASPTTFVAGAIFTAAQANTHMRDNPNELRGGGIAMASQAANDLVYCSSATQFARIANAASSVLVTNGSSVPSLGTSLPNSLYINSQVRLVSGGQAALANGGTINAGAVGGFVFCYQYGAANRGAIYYGDVQAASTTEISDPEAQFGASASASGINIYYSGGNLTFQNNLGSNMDIRYIVFRDND